MEIVNVIMAALFLLVILYLVAQVFMKPISCYGKLLSIRRWDNITDGGQLYRAYFDFSLPINIITVLVAGSSAFPVSFC
jgi:inhibitor of the pro-sigma K processing machinery